MNGDDDESEVIFSENDVDSLSSTVEDSRATTPKLLTSQPSQRHGLRVLSRFGPRADEETPFTSEKLTFEPRLSRKILHIQDLHSLKSIVDFSESAVLERLRIYLTNNSPRPIFYELLGNSQAASLSLFKNLLPNIISKARNQKSPGSSYTLLATIEAFLFHRINIRRVENFSKVAHYLRKAFSQLDRSFVAFFVLTEDLEGLRSLRNNVQVNSFAVDRALQMLPEENQMLVARTLFENVVPVLYNTNIHRRIFRNADNVELCRFLINECRFNPSDHPDCFKQARFPLGHKKWDFFREVYGSEVIDEGYLMTDQIIRPQEVPKIRLPFEISAVNEDEWEVYSRAYGRLFIAKYHELTSSGRI